MALANMRTGDPRTTHPGDLLTHLRVEHLGTLNAKARFCVGCEAYFDEQRQILDEETALGMGLNPDGSEKRPWHG